MRVRIAEPVMIENLQQFGFFEGGDCLARLVVVHQNDLEPRRIEHIALARNATVKAVFIHDPVIVVLIAQDSVEKIADMSIGGEFWHGRVGGVPAWGRHHFAHGCIAGLRTEHLA